MQSIGEALIKIKNPKSFIRQPDNKRTGITIIDGVYHDCLLIIRQVN